MFRHNRVLSNWLIDDVITQTLVFDFIFIFSCSIILSIHGTNAGSKPIHLHSSHVKLVTLA